MVYRKQFRMQSLVINRVHRIIMTLDTRSVGVFSEFNEGCWGILSLWQGKRNISSYFFIATSCNSFSCLALEKFVC